MGWNIERMKQIKEELDEMNRTKANVDTVITDTLKSEKKTVEDIGNEEEVEYKIHAKQERKEGKKAKYDGMCETLTYEEMVEDGIEKYGDVPPDKHFIKNKIKKS